MRSAQGSSNGGLVRVGAVAAVLVGITAYLLAPAPPGNVPNATAADALSLGTLNVNAIDGSGTAVSVDGLRAATGAVRVSR